MSLHTPVLVSLIRTRTGIVAWISHVADDGTLQLTSHALADVPTHVFDGRDALLRDWNALANANSLEAVWASIWRVYWQTLPDAAQTTPIPHPPRTTQATRPIATAAHPRAFRGTKYKPPKPASPKLSLPAWLAEDRLFDALLASPDRPRLPICDWHDTPPPLTTEHAPSCAELLGHRYGMSPDVLANLPEKFRTHFLWSLRDAGASCVLAWLNIWHSISHAEDSYASARLARLCALEPQSHAWVRLVQTLPPTRQTRFLDKLLQYAAYRAAPDTALQENLTALSADTPDDERFALYIDALLANLQRGVPARYTLHGCQIANLTPDNHLSETRLHAHTGCDNLPMDAIQQLHTPLHGTEYGHWPLSVWRDCAEHPAFSEIVRNTQWHRLSPYAADRWLALFSLVIWDSASPKQAAKRWPGYVRAFPILQAFLSQQDSHWQEKCADMLFLLFGNWPSAENLSASLPYLLPLVARMCRPPFSATFNCANALCALATYQTEMGWEKLAATSDEIWLKVENANHNDNDDSLIRYGLHALSEAWPTQILNYLETATRRLMHAAHLLGCVSYEHRRQITRRIFGTSPWFSQDFASLPPLQACADILRMSREDGLDSPLPRRLREHLEGRCNLSAMQARTLERLPATQLLAFEEAVWRELDTPFGLRHHSASARNAIRLHASVADNRKSLRRVLRHYSRTQNRFYTLDAPANRRWFAQHPHINATLWSRTGLSITYDSLTLSLETDPLEVLMLGTYAQTCLAPGGLCDYSAAACLLDANKQVIYARDASSRVIARQTLAIDEQERLVCFSVYPLDAEERILTAFLEYDKKLAEALQIERYDRDKHGDYYVASLVAREWWDDGEWQYAPASTEASD